MPNWCYTDVCFRGNPENINKLYDDIHSSIIWMRENKYNYVNLFYFFSLNNFDAETYLNRYTKRLYLGNSIGHHMWFPLRISFRGSFVDYSAITNNDDGTCTLNAVLEMAWNTDYEILHLISIMYNVKFSAYSEELGMGIHTKCRNCDLQDFNFDIVVYPDSEQAEEFMDKFHDADGELYPTAFKLNDPEYNNFIKFLNDTDIDYYTQDVVEINANELAVYGVYYDPITGVTYEDNNSTLM